MLYVIQTICVCNATKSHFHYKLGNVVAVYTLSLAFNIDFTLANTSSNGMRSGLYGGRNIILAPTPVISSSILSRWCMLALSITRIDRGLLPSNGRMIGSIHSYQLFKTILSETPIRVI